MNQESTERFLRVIFNMKYTLKDIQIRTRDDVAKYSHDDAIAVINWVRESAEAALDDLKKEGI